MFKKAAAFVLATVLALTMAACGQTTDDANQTSARPATTAKRQASAFSRTTSPPSCSR